MPKNRAPLKIGKSTEILTNATKSFLQFPDPYRPLLFPSASSDQIFDPAVDLRIQNAPEDTLLLIRGAESYERVYKLLRLLLKVWWGLFYRNIRISAFPFCEPQVDAASLSDSVSHPVLKLRWKVEGIPRTLLTSPPPKHNVILAGNSYYHFDGHSGLVKLHVVDRIVPPSSKGSWLWWALERRQLATPMAPKPLINSNLKSTPTL